MTHTAIVPGLPGLIADSIRANWNRAAIGDFHGSDMTYAQLAARIAELHLIFRGAGLRKGDRIALCARNSAEWAATFLGAMTYGAVVVPLLHEFHPGTVEHLVNHSEARLLISEDSIVDALDEEHMPRLDGIVTLPGFRLRMSRSRKLTHAVEKLPEAFAESYPSGLTPEAVRYPEPDPQATALINYTSGSTGNSKGVMLSYANLAANVTFGMANIPFLHPGDGMVSMLPLAHMYGLVFEFIFPLCKGCHVTFLGRVPSPKVVLDAFAQIRPKLVITVPLVIEKIVKGKVFPQLRRQPARTLLAIPGLRNVVYSKVRAQLLKAFGGQLEQLILGGAAMSAEVEEFLRRIKFPFTVGYGMTECAPLVTYEWWASQRPHSCGRLVDGMEARVDSPDPASVPGVLSVRGANVMQGYFKNEEATREALSPDGWLNTGDICTIDKDGYVYLRGRDKNMILGPSGQNIYPEEIEVVLNNLPLVSESVVVERDGRIVALVHPDYDEGRRLGMTEASIEKRVEENLPALNKELPAYSRVSRFEIHRDEFEKTPKHSIRRFIYK
ncbi:MAG: AMP-binding protein [Muribaculaceae bacterium]|nr:AMP-binding protein [Muribaculaceae bacterium]